LIFFVKIPRVLNCNSIISIGYKTPENFDVKFVFEKSSTVLPFLAYRKIIVLCSLWKNFRGEI